MKNFKVNMRAKNGFKIKGITASSIGMAENYLLKLIFTYYKISPDESVKDYIIKTTSERKLILMYNGKRISIGIKGD